jgi:vacuolar-type H+-ATPase subunit D/Vma8
VKQKTEVPNLPASQLEDKEYDMSGFMKTKKECINLKSLEKTKKILETILELIDKEPTFLEMFDP